MLRYAFLLWLLAFSLPATAAITAGTTTPATPVTTGTTISVDVSPTFTGTCGGLAIGVGWGHNSSAPDLAASNPITIDGTPAATVQRSTTLGTFEAAAVAFLGGLSSDTYTVTVTFASGVDIAWLAVTPIEGDNTLATNSSAGADASSVAVTSDSGNYVFSALMDGNNAGTSADDTSRYATGALATYWSGGMSSAAGSTTSTTLTWSTTTSPRIAGLSVEEGAGCSGGGGSVIPVLHHQLRNQ